MIPILNITLAQHNTH